MKIAFALTLVIALLGTTTSLAQDPLGVDPGADKNKYNNEPGLRGLAKRGWRPWKKPSNPQNNNILAEGLPHEGLKSDDKTNPGLRGLGKKGWKPMKKHRKPQPSP
jgi:hypothetical protein